MRQQQTERRLHNRRLPSFASHISLRQSDDEGVGDRNIGYGLDLH